MTDATSYRALVEKIELGGKHGPYAVARVVSSNDDIKGPITFALLEPVWAEGDNPEPGTYVILSRLRSKKAGWRAMSARYEVPSDSR
jgi:hypothetical protein